MKTPLSTKPLQNNQEDTKITKNGPKTSSDTPNPSEQPPKSTKVPPKVPPKPPKTTPEAAKSTEEPQKVPPKQPKGTKEPPKSTKKTPPKVPPKPPKSITSKLRPPKHVQDYLETAKEPPTDPKEAPITTKELLNDTNATPNTSKEPPKTSKEPTNSTKKTPATTKEPSATTKDPSKITREPPKDNKSAPKKTKEIPEEQENPKAKESPTKKEASRPTKEPSASKEGPKTSKQAPEIRKDDPKTTKAAPKPTKDAPKNKEGSKTTKEPLKEKPKDKDPPTNKEASKTTKEAQETTKKTQKDQEAPSDPKESPKTTKKASTTTKETPEPIHDDSKSPQDDSKPTKAVPKQARDPNTSIAMDTLDEEVLNLIFEYIDDIRARARLAAVCKRLRLLLKEKECGLRDVKVRLRLNSPPVCIRKRGVFNAFFEAFQAKSVFSLISSISVLEIRKSLSEVEASSVVKEIRRRDIPVGELVVLPASKEDQGRLLSDVLAPVLHELPVPGVLKLYQSFALDDAFANGLGSLRRLELGAELQVDELENLQLPSELEELRIATQLDAENASIAFLPLLAQLHNLRVLQVSGVVFAMENENTFTSFVRLISSENMPELTDLEFTDCQFRQSYIPRTLGLAKWSSVKRLAFLDHRGKFGRNHTFVRVMCSEISPRDAVLNIDVDLEELDLFWRQSIPLIASRRIALELGVEERGTKRRPNYPLPPSNFCSVLTSLTIKRLSDAHMLENWWRWHHYSKLRTLRFQSSQVSDRCLDLLLQKCSALELLSIAEDHQCGLLGDVLSPLLKTWTLRRSKILRVELEFLEAFQRMVEIPFKIADFKAKKLASNFESHMGGATKAVEHKVITIWCRRTGRVLRITNFINNANGLVKDEKPKRKPKI